MNHTEIHESYNDDNYNMIEITNDNSEETGSQVPVQEEPWSQKAETLITDWIHQIFASQKKHEKAGYFYKKLRKIWGLPCVLIPAVMAPISNVFADYENIQYLNMTAFVLTAVFTGVDSFFSFNLRRERHFTYSARYGELHNEIIIEMIKKRKFRIQSDVFLTRMQMRFDTLNANAPVLPKAINDKEVTYPSTYELIDET